MTKQKKRQFIGYRMPHRFYKKIEALLPLYDYNFSAVLDAILMNWEVSDFYARQQIAVQKMRFKLLEKIEEKQ